MLHSWSARFASVLALTSIVAGTAFAAVFPDVPNGHMYQTAVESLAAAGVVKGNPDGMFWPDRSVNRAEMLTLLYRAKGFIPDSGKTMCFPDVPPGSWFEAVVCDATARRFVSGYADGTFKPSQEVNRVEALKMIATVFGRPIENISDTQRDIVKFVDVSTSAWYTKYLYDAFEKKILPIAGQNGSHFYPEKVLLRGEAAAYIYNAMNAQVKADASSAAAAASSSSAAAAAEEKSDVLDVEFPFNINGVFHGKKPLAIRFDIKADVVAATLASLTSLEPGSLTCRLYLLGEEGFSDQYFLGLQEGASCSLMTSLSPGSYQLQIQPTEADAPFTASSRIATGDGNDGFREARPLTLERISGSFPAGDLQDWYTFTVESPRSLTVEFARQGTQSCVVYAMKNVDLAGFTMPECNASFDYTPGTYYVAVGRSAPKTDQQSYSILLK